MIRKLKGGNVDLDLCSGDTVDWPQDPCPWNVEENADIHYCAIKNTSICPYFAGLGDGKKLDMVLCSYPEKFEDINK
jgi:hypothetical protein